MNEVNLIGRLTKDADLRKTPAGKSVSSVTLAVRKKGDEAEFIPCVAWDKTAELIANYCKKGDRIGVTGHLSTRSYEDKTTGKKVFVMEVTADKVYFIESRKNKEESEDGFPF